MNINETEAIYTGCFWFCLSDILHPSHWSYIDEKRYGKIKKS